MLTTNGHLTASGLLYEGNFDEWKDRMSAIFITTGRPEHAYPSIIYKRAVSYTGKMVTVYRTSGFQEIVAMRNQISPSLLVRLPVDFNMLCGAFYAQLERYCRPFRLMDLPAELRMRIYEEVLEDNAITPFFSESWKMKCSRRMLALARTSQQLRNEILPIYFATTDFKLDINMNIGEAYLGYGYHWVMKDIVKDWAYNFVGRSVKHLRKIILRMSVMQGGDFPSVPFELCFDKRKGYRIVYDQDWGLKECSRKEIEKHVARIETWRARDGVQGESLLMALVGEHHFFDYTMLELEDRR